MLVGPQRPAHVEPRHVGQPQVEQHEVGLALGERGQPVGAVGGLADLVALVLERQAQRQADRVVVLDEQQRVHSAAILPASLHGVGRFCYRNRTIARRRSSHASTHDDDCSRCPGGVPSSPWCLTGSGDVRLSAILAPCRRRVHTDAVADRRAPPAHPGHAASSALIALLAGLSLTVVTYALRPLLAARPAHRASPSPGRQQRQRVRRRVLRRAGDDDRRRASEPAHRARRLRRSPSSTGDDAVRADARRSRSTSFPAELRRGRRRSASRACSASPSTTASRTSRRRPHRRASTPGTSRRSRSAPTERTLRDDPARR